MGIPLRLHPARTEDDLSHGPPQPTSYRSLALSPLQRLLDLFLPAPRAALQLPVLCHVSVRQAQESTGVLLQPDCLSLKHRDVMTTRGSHHPPVLFRNNSKQKWMLASLLPASYRSKRVGRCPMALQQGQSTGKGWAAGKVAGRAKGHSWSHRHKALTSKDPMSVFVRRDRELRSIRLP